MERLQRHHRVSRGQRSAHWWPLSHQARECRGRKVLPRFPRPSVPNRGPTLTLGTSANGTSATLTRCGSMSGSVPLSDFSGRVLASYDSLRLARLHPLEPAARYMRRLVYRRAGACSFPGLAFRAPTGGRTYDNRLHNAVFDYDWPVQSRQYKQSQQRR